MPLKISLKDIGKRYARQQVLSRITCELHAPEKYAVLGANGSGKSTLLRIIAGMQAPGEGTIAYTLDGANTEASAIYRQVSFCAPGIMLPEELTLREMVAFHFTFKKFLRGITARDVPALLGLERFRDRPVGDYSSGMRQRVKLGLCFLADTPLLLLDEPCSNLDDAGIGQYEEWMRTYTPGRLTIVASNDPREWSMCGEVIRLEV